LSDNSSGQSIIELNKLKAAMMLGYMMLGEEFEGTLALVQMKREMRTMGYTDFDKLKEIGMRKYNSSSTTKTGTDNVKSSQIGIDIQDG